MEEAVFQSKIDQVLDSYYDREFFTNLIYCIDRKKTLRDIFEAAIRNINQSTTWSKDLDRALVNVLIAYQASSAMRENYQWLPLANALFGFALYRSNGQKPVPLKTLSDAAPSALSVDEFRSLIRKEVRAVEPKERAWTSLLFLLDNRTMRSQAVTILLKEAVMSGQPLDFILLTRSLEVSLSTGWKSSKWVMRRAFDNFWDSQGLWAHGTKAQSLVVAAPIDFGEGLTALSKNHEENFWTKLRNQGAESAWNYLRELSREGLSSSQAFCLLTLVRGRALFEMKKEQWARVTDSLLWGDALTLASQLAPEETSLWLALNILDAADTLRLLPQGEVSRPSGATILDAASQSISKDRLVLRLDDQIEQGHRQEALELVAAILKDAGLSRTVNDRLLLMASKQDSWTFDFKTLSVAFVISAAFEASSRFALQGDLSRDALFGLLRWLADIRDFSLELVQKTGTYGDGLKLSIYDVSGGARIVDRFVFNQMRNAQRVKVWPSDDF